MIAFSVGQEPFPRVGEDLLSVFITPEAFTSHTPLDWEEVVGECLDTPVAPEPEDFVFFLCALTLYAL